MIEIDAETLIKSVKNRPALYNKNNVLYYSHQKQKARLWTDICREVVPNWDSLRPQDKVEHGHELQKRWKNLRTCFSRELNTQKQERMKNERNIGRVKRRKRYEYFDMMTFLLHPDSVETEDHEETKDSDDNFSDPLDSSIKAETVYGETSENIEEEPATLMLESSDGTHFQQSFFERSKNVEERILEMLKDIKKDEEDEDRQFMLSLVPSFRKLQDKQKFEARIGILKVLKNISFQE